MGGVLRRDELLRCSVREQEGIVSLPREAGARDVWDVGGNTGAFSRVAAGLGATVVCMDVDPGAWR